jgi:hypothetical protein
MHVKLEDGFGEVAIGRPGEVLVPHLSFTSRDEAMRYLRRIADTDPELQMLRDLVVRGLQAPMMLSDDGVYVTAAEAVLDRRLVVHETPYLMREAVRRRVVDLEIEAPPQRLAIAEIMAKYKVPTDAVRAQYQRIPGMDPVRVTETEARMLDDLDWGSCYIMKDCKVMAFELSEGRFPTDFPLPAWVKVLEKDTPEFTRRFWRDNDGHRDALRHALWNALMARQLGVGFARLFSTAHEGGPGNHPVRMAMDLWNNQVGRRIFLANRTLGEHAIADLLKQAVERGETTVIDRTGALAYSDQVKYGEHGLAPSPG